MANRYTFNPYGVTISSPTGDVILNAGENITITPQGTLVTIAAPTPLNTVINNLTPWQPPSMADVKAPNNSVYFSTDSNKLVYKDAAGLVNNLY